MQRTDISTQQKAYQLALANNFNTSKLRKSAKSHHHHHQHNVTNIESARVIWYEQVPNITQVHGGTSWASPESDETKTQEVLNHPVPRKAQRRACHTG